MGTDIHSIIEYDDRHPTPEYRKWVRSRVQIFPNPYAEFSDRINNWYAPFEDRPFRSRDYDLFAMLNDVRNDGNITPMQTEDRDIPEDASKSARKFLDGLHSITWFTLKELADAHAAGHFTQDTWEQGCISATQYRDLIEHGTPPESWSGGIGGGSIRLGNEDEVLPLLQRGRYTPLPEGVPPMPGEPPRVRPPFGDDGAKIGDFTHVNARWNRTIDRSEQVGAVIEIAKRFAAPIGPRDGDPWIRDPETGVGIELKPDTRERDLTSVRFLIGYDS